MKNNDIYESDRSYRQQGRSDTDGSQIQDEIDGQDEDELLRVVLSEVRESLEPTPPVKGVNIYLRNRSELRAGTIEEYREKLDYFLEFCDQVDIDNLNELSGRDITRYHTWRREESSDLVDSLATKTMKDDMLLLRDFLRHMEAIDAVESGLSDAVPIPEVDDEGRDVDLDPERVEEILSYLEKYEYATLDHVVMLLIARTARRIGAIIGLDRGDHHPDSTDPYLEFIHRPETPLKNGEDGEGQVALATPVSDIIQDYVETHRHEITDEHGRQPLLTTSHGRPSKSTIRRIVYRYTRPCHIGKSCPHGKDPETCDATASGDDAAKCESSRSPHALRHGYLTDLLRRDIPKEVICDRCDLSERTLEKYYDERSEEEKRQHRKQVLESFWENGGGYL